MYFVFLANLQKKEIIRILKIGTLRIRKHLLFCGTFGNELVKTLNNNNFEVYWPTLKYTRAHDLPANLRALKSSLQCPKLQSRPSTVHMCVGQYKKGGQIFGQDKHHIAVLQKQDFRTSKKNWFFTKKTWNVSTMFINILYIPWFGTSTNLTKHFCRRVTSPRSN